MRHTRGITFVDSLIALTILLGGGISLALLSKSSLSAWHYQKEQAVAREIIAQVRYLAPARMRIFGEQRFDAWGQPGFEHIRFTLSVRDRLEGDRLYWACSLTYKDYFGQRREIEFLRRQP